VSQDSRTTKERMTAFIQKYADTCNMRQAAEEAGIERRTHYRWMSRYPRYAQTFRATKAAAGEYLENIAVERATDGWLEDVYYQGSKCGEVRRYSDGLMQTLLRGMLPEKYGYTRAEVSGPNGGPIETKVTVVYVDPPSEQ
jgi:hypothetical protein